MIEIEKSDFFEKGKEGVRKILNRFKHTEEESNATPSKSRDFEELFMRFMRKRSS